jgi:uncharacterized glyoxalase superfamily protein PhnB
MPPELVIPMLVCRCASAEIEFCKAAFGAVELSRRTAQNGDVLHAALKIGAAMIMVHGEVPTFASRAPQMDGSSSVVIYLYYAGGRHRNRPRSWRWSAPAAPGDECILGRPGRTGC